MQKVEILQGPPASGKSTYAIEKNKQDPSYVRVNRDSLRRMRGIYWLPEQENLISKWERGCVKSALIDGKNVVIDSMHIGQKYIDEWIKLLSEFELEITVIPFNTPLEICLQRDLAREEKVGEEIIRKKYQAFNSISAEKYTIYVEPFKVEKIIQDKSLPRAIIVDLDGTLCLHNGRGPFEYDKCDTDIPNDHVSKIVLDYFYKRYTNSHLGNVIFVSGREDFCREKTIKWIEDHVGLVEGNYQLFMRKTNDHRKDFLIKKEIFDAEIKDKYYVDFCLDDRLQVCRMWHKLGLPLLKVGDPDGGDF